jgi:hypothetical protein|tara:strand:- start:987 stop:1454 length:468 start_codon:yes stop_codon:yes gene_type:complete
MISFTKTYWDRILEPIRNFIRLEFGQQVNVYIHPEYQEMTAQSIRVYLESSRMVEELSNGQVRECDVEISFYFRYPKTTNPSQTEKVTERMFTDVDRLQQLLFNNRNYEVSGDRYFFNGTIDDIVVNSKKSDEANIDNLQVVRFDFTCQTLMNIS